MGSVDGWPAAGLVGSRVEVKAVAVRKRRRGAREDLRTITILAWYAVRFDVERRVFAEQQ